MKAKRLFALLCTCFLVFSLCASALAAEKQEIIDLGDGFYMVVTTEQMSVSRASDVVTGTGYFSSGSDSRSITLTLTCSPNGDIS